MNVGDKVKVVNVNSSFCGEIGTVVEVAFREIQVQLPSVEHTMSFYKEELDVVAKLLKRQKF